MALPPLVAYRTRERIVGHFCAFSAIEAREAVRFVPQHPGEVRQLDWMRARGIVREVRKGYYWVDLGALAADREARRRRLVPLTFFGCVIAAWLLTRMFVVVRF